MEAKKRTQEGLNFCYKYPHPSVTTDCVIFGFDGAKLKVLLIQRGIEPYKGRWAFPGGFLKMDESAEEGALRELHEETGLFLDEVIDILPPSYAAVGFSDVLTYIAIVKAKGTLSDAFLSENEDIEARFYTVEEVKKLLETEKFSSRAQVMAYFYANGYYK